MSTIQLLDSYLIELSKAPEFWIFNFFRYRKQIKSLFYFLTVVISHTIHMNVIYMPFRQS
jgi:hypothetical protein